ncbi:hypothetical protein AB0G15_19815 [Streptosporangium sp. NPDC023825]|uniref:hypothetical protein n=1 Tax=Streptosporangium sp. NPDC023825 TaxID=3154909 RepID=UPI00343E32ED
MVVRGRPASGLPARAAGEPADRASVAPLTILRLTDPREWSASSWVSDIVPHLAYGLTAATVYDRLTQA